MDKKQLKENLIKTTLFITAASSIGIVFFIVIYMVDLGYPVLAEWFNNGFGFITPYAFGSIYLAIGGTVLGVIVGLPCAIYLAEFADMRFRKCY